MMTKRCSKCGEVKGVEEFYKKRSGKYGVGYWCKICHKKYNRKWMGKWRKKCFNGSQAWNRKQIKDLTDSYICGLLFLNNNGLSRKNITAELIEAKRLVVRAKREGLIHRNV